MRDIRPGNVTFMTISTKGTASDPIAGSIVVVDKAKSVEWFTVLPHKPRTLATTCH